MRGGQAKAPAKLCLRPANSHKSRGRGRAADASACADLLPARAFDPALTCFRDSGHRATSTLPASPDCSRSATAIQLSRETYRLSFTPLTGAADVVRVLPRFAVALGNGRNRSIRRGSGQSDELRLQRGLFKPHRRARPQELRALHLRRKAADGQFRSGPEVRIPSIHLPTVCRLRTTVFGDFQLSSAVWKPHSTPI